MICATTADLDRPPEPTVDHPWGIGLRHSPRHNDVIIVPAGVVHGWFDIPEHVDYLSFRPSPGILTAGWVHPVLRK
jgi:hypothetical protein